MYEKVTVADLCIFFNGQVVLYKDKPAKVKAISADRVFKILDLESGKTVLDKDAIKYITPPLRRLGMVNVDGWVFYLSRKPIRVMQMGLSSQNVSLKELDMGSEESLAAARKKASELECREIADCLFNRYPSIADCIINNREFGGGMAFDKQFAIDSRRRIWYKTAVVGELPKNCSTAAKIEWKKGYEFLTLLLDGNYEKDSRVAWKKAPQR